MHLYPAGEFDRSGRQGRRRDSQPSQASRDTAAKLGIVRKNVYMTFGPYDFVQIIEAPDDEAVAKYVLSVTSKGNVRTTTMRAFDEPEHFEFLKNLP